MSTTVYERKSPWTEIDNPLEKTHPLVNNKLEIMTGIGPLGNCMRIFIYRKDTGIGEKFTLTEAEYRELMEGLETAAHYLDWSR